MRTGNLIKACGTAAGIALLASLTPGALAAQAQPASAAKLNDIDAIAGAEKVLGILVVSTLEEINPAGVTGVKGVQIKGPKYLQTKQAEALLGKYLNGKLTRKVLDDLQGDLIKYCRQHDHNVVDVFLRDQEIQEGTIQIAVIDAKIGAITVNNPGHKWFSDKLVLRNVRLREGGAITESGLRNDLNWLNRNGYQSMGVFDGSFREVNATLKQGKLGETDVDLQVQDRFPLRAFAGLDNAGVSVLGNHRINAGAEWANAWGIDHRIGYQFTSDLDFQKLKLHSASYTAPLPWRHEFTVYGAYADVHPDFSKFNPVDPTQKAVLNSVSTEGTVEQIGARYTIPLPSGRSWDHDISFGYDFYSPHLYALPQ